MCLRAVTACGAEPGEPSQQSEPPRALQQQQQNQQQQQQLDEQLERVRRLVRRDVKLAQVLAPNPQAFTTGADGLASQAARGKVKGGLAGVAAWLPERADRSVQISIGRSRRLALRLTDPQGNNVPALVSQGRVVYQDSHPATDTIIASSKTALEVLWLLRDDSAPETFSWNVKSSRTPAPRPSTLRRPRRAVPDRPGHRRVRGGRVGARTVRA